MQCNSNIFSDHKDVDTYCHYDVSGHYDDVIDKLHFISTRNLLILLARPNIFENGLF